MVTVELNICGRWDWDYREADDICFFNVPTDDFDLIGGIGNLISDFVRTSPKGAEVMAEFSHANATEVEDLDLGDAIAILTSGEVPDEMFAKYGFSLVNPADTFICRNAEDKLYSISSAG